MLNTDRLCLSCMNDTEGKIKCPVCGYDNSLKNGSNFLPAKYLLNNRYFIGKPLDIYQNEILYIAFDKHTDSVVNIREYFPKDIAVRNPDKTISSLQENKYAFNGGLMSYIEFNTKLIEFDRPSLIPTLDCFEENGTAYVVNSVFNGITLQDFIERNGGCLEWEQVRPLFLSFIDTIKGLHDIGIIHGSISPDNVFVSRDGKLLLNFNYYLDALSYTINPGYSAIEQYNSENFDITPAVDVYALSAIIFTVLIGNPPTAADLRLENDSLSIPTKFAQKLPRNVLVALANGLQISKENRTPDIEGFKNELFYGDSPDGTAINKSETNRTSAKKETPKNSSNAKYAVISAVCTTLFFLLLAGILSLTVFKDFIFPKKPTDNNSSNNLSSPSSQVIGSIDEGAELPPKEYTVPNFINKYYYSIIENNDNYKYLKIVVKDKVFSDKYAKGTVCEQSVKPGTKVTKETEVSVVISLGPKEVVVPNIVGLDKSSAEVELLKKGFLFVEFIDMYDSDKKPGVIQQEPAFGTKTVTDISVKVYINNYTGEEDSNLDSNYEE